ncbi:MAG: hypothetical protein ABJO67_00365 [Pseudoruegeria sp.]
MRIGFMAIFLIITGFTVAAVDFSRRQTIHQAAGEAYSVRDYTLLLSDIAASRMEAAGLGIRALRVRYSENDTSEEENLQPEEDLTWKQRLGLNQVGKPSEDDRKVFTCASDRGFKSCKVGTD